MTTTAVPTSFEDLVRLATVVAEVPLAFITVVDDTRTFRNAHVGADLPTPYEPAVDHYKAYLIAAGGPVVINDTSLGARMAGDPGQPGIGAWAGYPILGASDEIVGGFFVVSHQPRQWSEWEIQTLATLARAASLEIALRETLRISEERLVAMTEAHQLAVGLARMLQDSLLPPALPAVPGVEVAARYQAAGTIEVMGDFYDLFHVTGGWWCAVIGDVCGHGIEAAKVTALARYTLRADANLHELPSVVLADLHRALVAQNGIDGRYLTAAYATFHVAESGIDGAICLAGHPQPAIRRADGSVEKIGVSGSLLGALSRVRLTDVEFHLGAGDLLLFYTDGLIERRHGDVQFGDDDFHPSLAATAGFSAYDTIAHVVEAADAFADGRAEDDTAVLAIRVSP